MSKLSLGTMNAHSLMSANKYHFCLETKLTSLAGKGKTWHGKQEVMEHEVIVQAENNGKVKNRHQKTKNKDSRISVSGLKLVKKKKKNYLNKRYLQICSKAFAEAL